MQKIKPSSKSHVNNQNCKSRTQKTGSQRNRNSKHTSQLNNNDKTQSESFTFPSPFPELNAFKDYILLKATISQLWTYSFIGSTVRCSSIRVSTDTKSSTIASMICNFFMPYPTATSLEAPQCNPSI